MTRLPWQHNRTRTKSGSDKGTTQDWFLRHTSEPSRQALSDLVKAHKREKSDESHGSGTRSRSRSNTITSVDWQSNRSRAGSVTGDPSRSDSSLHTREGSIYSSMDRPEMHAKNLLSKGGLLLRRTGSKMSLSSAGSSSALGFTSPPRNQSASSSSTGEELRSKISAPFDFQHVTHTEQAQFSGLSCIAESELANQFSAAVNRQSSVLGLKGIEASEIHNSEPVEAAALSMKNFDAPLPQLPAFADGPTPPPKDRAAEDYITSKVISPTSASTTHRLSPGSPKFPSQMPPHPIASEATADTDTIDLTVKPLPSLPVIHAVTTEDDTARAMIAVPLPTPPGTTPPASEIGRPERPHHQRQKSSLALPRHFSLRPAAKSSMPNLLSADYLTPEAKGLSRHHSDMALSAQLRQDQSRTNSRLSMSFAAIDAMNWEEAVDEAWDDETSTLEESQLLSLKTAESSSSNLLNSFSSEDGRSAMSTPLMMNAPSQPLPAIPADMTSPSMNVEVHKLESVQEDEQQDDLAGLGISSCPTSGPAPPSVQLSRSSSLHYSKRRSSIYMRQNETLTRSSSQESIILSIASSIIGTQRSSNSSLAPEDIIGAGKIEEETASEAGDTELKPTVRPESGCLPSNILEQMVKAASSPNASVKGEGCVPPVPLIPQHKHSKSASKVAVPERRSSVAASDHSRTTRKRSNTTGNKPRQSTRISYSLFPTATPPPSSITP